MGVCGAHKMKSTNLTRLFYVLSILKRSTKMADLSQKLNAVNLSIKIIEEIIRDESERKDSQRPREVPK